MYEYTSIVQFQLYPRTNSLLQKVPYTVYKFIRSTSEHGGIGYWALKKFNSIICMKLEKTVPGYCRVNINENLLY